MDNAKVSIEMAKRLRALREQKQLSHEKLGEELFKKYKDCNERIPDDKLRKQKKKEDTESPRLISKDSLINYEADSEHHTKAFKNLGMSIENLVYLADFYGVSTDYLLCRTDIESPDRGVQAICTSTRLTENAAKTLVSLDSPCSINLIDKLLEAPSELLEKLAKKYIAYIYAKNVIKPTAEKYRDELGANEIFADIYVFDGQAMPHVKVQDAFDYAKFELWRAFGEFFEM